MEEVGNEDLAVTNPGRYAGMGIMISGTVRSRHAGFEIGRLSRRSDNGLPGLDSRRCFVYELLLTREKFYEEADYVWRRTGTGPQSSGHGCVRDIISPLSHPSLPSSRQLFSAFDSVSAFCFRHSSISAFSISLPCFQFTALASIILPRSRSGRLRFLSFVSSSSTSSRS